MQRLTGTDDPIFYFGLIPRRNRRSRWRRRRRFLDWWRVAALLAVVGGLVAGAIHVPSPIGRWGCFPSLRPAADVWSQDDECVGISDGPYAFGNPGFEDVFEVIDQQNRNADTAACDVPGQPVTVGVLMTLTSPNAVGRALHELEGFAATQAAANADPHCSRAIRLRVGQTGAGQQAAVEVATRLVDSGVVGIVGMGLSDPVSARAVEAVAAMEHPVPMVADLISADGFDGDGARDTVRGDQDLSACTNTAEYADGIGRGWFFRVSHRNAVQVDRIIEFAGQRKVSFLIRPTTTADPANCTSVPDYRRRLANPAELVFDPDDPGVTLDQAINPICQATGDVWVVYGARGKDVARFLTGLDERYNRNTCTPTSVTVLEGSDGVRLRSEDPDPQRDRIRLAALRSPNFSSGRIQLFLTPLANPDLATGDAADAYGRLADAFARHGFDTAHLDDGWALNAHDALTTMIQGIGKIRAGGAVTGSTVHAAIRNNFQTQPVPGAIQGPLRFDVAGNRSGAPTLVRLCPLPDDVAERPRVRSVPADPGTC